MSDPLVCFNVLKYSISGRTLDLSMELHCMGDDNRTFSGVLVTRWVKDTIRYDTGTRLEH